jgi:hypothetical protein
VFQSFSGYSRYRMTAIGLWYTLAGVALLAPGFPRIKERASLHMTWSNRRKLGPKK